MMIAIKDVLAKVDPSLLVRIRSALIFGVVALFILYMGGGIFTLVMAAAAAVCVHEWGKMVLTGQEHHKMLLPIASGMTALSVAVSGLVYNPATTLWLPFAFCFLVMAFNFLQNGPAVGQLLIGMIYIGFSFEIMVWLRNSTGLFNMLTLLMIIWASDVSAYFSGKTIGGAKLAPAISPNKTWAGFIGSSVGAAVVAAVLTGFSDTTIGDMSWFGYAVMGFILAMFGQAGDLLISVFKRHYGIKDTGTILPGHGGLLDRVDALLLVALLFGSLTILLK